MKNELNKKVEERPWGMFEQFTLNERSTVKIITVKEGEQLGLQYHEHRQEFWRVIEGNPTMTVGDKVMPAKAGDEFFVDVKQHHRIAGPGKILEIAFGTFDENDITRLDDKYGRAK